MDPIERVLVALIEIQRSRAHRIVGARAYVIRNIGKSVLDLRGGNPGRPFFLAPDPGDTRPRECFLADSDAGASVPCTHPPSAQAAKQSRTNPNPWRINPDLTKADESVTLLGPIPSPEPPRSLTES